MPLVTASQLPASTGNSNSKSSHRDVFVPLEMESHRLIQACQEGDEAAWNALVHHYQPILYRFAYSLCRNYDQTEDIVSEVLLRLYLNLSTFRREATFLAWLFSIARHVHLDLCIRPKHLAPLSLDTDPTCSGEYANGYDIPDPA